VSADEVDELIRLALWARKEGFLIGDVTLGSLKLRIRDLRIEDMEGLKEDLRKPESIWKQAGMDDDLPGDGTVG
jgi:hypothetical protein